MDGFPADWSASTCSARSKAQELQHTVQFRQLKRRSGSERGAISTRQNASTGAPRAMQEIGIDLSDAKPKKLTEELAKGAQLLIRWAAEISAPMFQGCSGMIGP